MIPQAVPQPASAARPGPQTGALGGGAEGTADTSPEVSESPGTTTPSPGAAIQKVVELAFVADRTQLYTAWNAVANLADMAGKVAVTLRAESEPGFDKGKLQNGVLEPLQELGLID